MRQIRFLLVLLALMALIGWLLVTHSRQACLTTCKFSGSSTAQWVGHKE